MCCTHTQAAGYSYEANCTIGMGLGLACSILFLIEPRNIVRSCSYKNKSSRFELDPCQAQSI